MADPSSLAVVLIPLAHAADWISLAFFVPVLAFMGWLAVTQIRERRAARQNGPRGDEHG